MTTSQSAVANWLPRRFVSGFAYANREGFEQVYGETLFLLVRLRSFTDPLAVGLAATCPLEAPEFAPSTAGNGDGGENRLGSSNSGRIVHAGLVQDWIATPIAQEPRFVVPIRKRLPSDEDRVTIGRSYERDIVFREESVSKLHAFFEWDESGAPWLVDAKSKNHTRVNGSYLTGRVPVRAGDVIRFGKVEAALCSAVALWSRMAGEA